jgi:nucleoside-diphosphate-sugar epimerase
MKTILISGGGGYLGTQLTINLLKRNRVIIYDKFYFPWLVRNKKNISHNHKLFFIKKDISKVAKKDFDKVDIVCDLAAIANDPSCELNKKITWKVNYFSRLKFAKIAKQSGVKRYIFNSSCSIYGFNKNITHENSLPNPISTYAKAVLKAEREIYKLNSKKFKINILRNSSLYGYSHEMRLDLAINNFVYNAIHNLPLLIDGNGLQFRPFIAVRDIVKVYDFIINKKKNLPSFICNLVAFNSTIKDIAFKILNILKTNSKIQFKENFADNRNYKIKSKYFKKLFSNKFIFSKFSKEILELKNFIKKYKIKKNSSTIRLKFYKKKYSVLY